MTSSRHSPEQLAAFSEGEPRFIAAAYRDATRARELFVMPDGQAGTLRQFTREQLRCLIPDCSAPDVVAVSRSRRRDGFRHKAGGGKHAPESVQHRQGKAVLAEWLRSRVGAAAVAVEAASDTQRRRVADVMVTFPSGQLLAFEIQYAAITVQEWRTRHESYRAQGIVDVWLWGHTRLRRARSSYDPPFRLDDVQDEVRTSGMPVHWFNPETSELATAVSEAGDAGLISIDDRCGDVMIERLAACGVTPTGIQSGALRKLAEHTAWWKAELERKETERLARRAQRIADDRRRSERADREFEERRAGALRGQPVARTYEKPGLATCRGCGKPMDPILIANGYHVLCDPGRWRS
ncbi:MAG: competence protein CoiA family protein [Burkholderiales bacterium]